MEFNPNNPIIRLCVQGMAAEEQKNPEEAGKLFFRAWTDASNDFERFFASYYIARQQKNIHEQLKWLQTAVQLALKVDSLSVKSALPALFRSVSECYAEINDHENAEKYRRLSKEYNDRPSDSGPFYHGTRADLQVGDLLTPGRNSNYQSGLTMNHIYFTAIANGAGLAASLAKGEGRERVYIVEPTGDFENDPNVTNKKFPGNPTRSYRTGSSLRIVGELTDWVRQSPEDIRKWSEKLDNNKGEIIN